MDFFNVGPFDGFSKFRVPSTIFLCLLQKQAQTNSISLDNWEVNKYNQQPYYEQFEESWANPNSTFKNVKFVTKSLRTIVVLRLISRLLIFLRKNINVYLPKEFQSSKHLEDTHSTLIIHCTIFPQFSPMYGLAATSLCCANQICSNCCIVPWLQNISP